MTTPITFEVPDHLIQELAATLHHPRYERVALLAGHRHNRHYIVRRVLEAHNTSAEPENFFRVGLDQWNEIRDRARRSGLTLVGLVHSHPYHAETQDGPSDTDLRMARSSPYDRLYGVYLSGSSRIVWYDRTGIIEATETIPLPHRKAMFQRIARRMGRLAATEASANSSAGLAQPPE